MSGGLNPSIEPSQWPLRLTRPWRGEPRPAETDQSAIRKREPPRNGGAPVSGRGYCGVVPPVEGLAGAGVTGSLDGAAGATGGFTG